MATVDRQRRHAAIGIGAVLLGMLPLGPPPRGQSGFAVREVAVEASGPTALAAREAAHREGFRTAWRRLLEAEAPDQAGRLAGLPDAELELLIDSFEIEREHVTATRYSATMTVVFRPEAVRGLLARGGTGRVRIEARTTFASLAEWAEIRRRLAASPAVAGVEVLRLSAAEARLAVTLTGGAERAAAQLAAGGLALGRGSDGEWRIALAAN